MTQQLLLALVLAHAVATAGCKEAGDPAPLGGETNWLKWCEDDAECRVGTCVCGVCTSDCGEGRASCADGPPNSGCFAAGSIGHAALCRSGDATGICLTSCAASGDCPSGFQCVVGACVPDNPSARASATNMPDAGGQQSGSVPGADPTRPELLRIRSADNIGSWGREVELAANCPPDNPCPTLEQALALNECSQVITGCGLVQVHQAIVSYWYEGFGSPPVGVARSTDVGIGPWSATRSLECGSVDVMCWTCDMGPLCEDVPAWLPPQSAPAPVPGCACEPDGAGGARVSLDCFCSIYSCPIYAAALAECPHDPTEELVTTIQSTSSCGQVWFKTAAVSGQRFGFDPNTGDLVGAEAFTPGPVAAPCSTYRVRAGEVRDCEAPLDCRCNTAPAFPAGASVDMKSCNDEAWFQDLSSEL